jgi:hypothetical protein
MPVLRLQPSGIEGSLIKEIERRCAVSHGLEDHQDRRRDNRDLPANIFGRKNSIS